MIKHELENLIQKISKELGLPDGSFTVERPADSSNGDYSTNIALVVAKEAGKSPQEVAETIKEKLKEEKIIDKTSIAGPGFINIFLTSEAIEKELSKENSDGALTGKKMHIEFISANPTGDLHIGHGRGGFYGDILANVLEFSGAEVVREFYINDSQESTQIGELGKTALGKGEQYKTEHLQKMIKSIDFSGKSEAEAGFLLGEKIQEYNKEFIEEKLGIKFDVWYSEDKKLRATGVNDDMLKKLEGFIEKKDGEGDALWLKTSEYGDDKDRVVLRSDRTKSYFISDISYHDEKFSKGYDTIIDVWGADHHGHVKRMQAVKEMLKWKGEFQIFITQLVSLKEGGERKKMSKRAGTAVLLEDLVDEIGIDVVRWFFAEKSLNTHMDFDMELARKQSADNPVFYVQYAHARIIAIEGNVMGLSLDSSTLTDTIAKKEGRALAMKILEFSEVVDNVANDFQVNKLTTYAYELANEFNQFYRDVRVINEDICDAGALALMQITKETLATNLKLLGISAPERM